jgi:hypothetical protein
MSILKLNKKIIFFLIISFLLINNLSNAYHYTNNINKEIDNIKIIIKPDYPEILKHNKNHDINIKDFGRLRIPGKPDLPSKIFSIAIPPDTELEKINYKTEEVIRYPGYYNITTTSSTRLIGEENHLNYDNEEKLFHENYNSVYNNNNTYPYNIVEFVRNSCYRKYNLIDIRINPVTYNPDSGLLCFYPKISLDIEVKTLNNNFDIIHDNLEKTEKIAEEIIINYNQAKNWYYDRNVLVKGANNYVIITIDSLTSIVDPLVEWEEIKGNNVALVTLEWIDDNYEGYDQAEKIRNFLIEKYPSSEWGIENVILIGHYDDLPIRRTWQDIDFGKPETDFYYAELTYPDHISWDSDGDHQYGEKSDNIDFYSEINVGRIPWSDPYIVSDIINKSIAFEQNNNPLYKNNILLMGAFFWNDTDNAAVMEKIIEQPIFNNWTKTKMYEKNTDYWSSYECDYNLLNDNVISTWNDNKYSIVNWAGHGTITSTHILGLDSPAFLSIFDIPNLNKDYPSIVFANSCSNSDTDYHSLGQEIIKNGAVGFLGPTKTSLASERWRDPNDGSSQSMDYFFTTRVATGEYTQGEALQWAIREMYTRNLWDLEKYEIFEWSTLLGNPNLGIKAIGDFPFLEINEIEGGSGITVTIINNGSTEAKNITCRINISNGLRIYTKDKQYLIPNLDIDESIEVRMFVFGFGLGLLTHFPIINITASVKYANTAEKSIKAKIIGTKVILL